MPEPESPREAQGWYEAAQYAEGNDVAQEDFMTGWRTADRLREDTDAEQERDAYAAVIEAECGEVSPAAAQVLAARDRRVAAEAVQAAADAVSLVRRRTPVTSSTMPTAVYEETRERWTYPAYAWLRVRADRIERGDEKAGV